MSCPLLHSTLTDRPSMRVQALCLLSVYLFRHLYIILFYSAGSSAGMKYRAFFAFTIATECTCPVRVSLTFSSLIYSSSIVHLLFCYPLLCLSATRYGDFQNICPVRARQRWYRVYILVISIFTAFTLHKV